MGKNSVSKLVNITAYGYACTGPCYLLSVATKGAADPALIEITNGDGGDYLLILMTPANGSVAWRSATPNGVYFSGGIYVASSIPVSVEYRACAA